MHPRVVEILTLPSIKQRTHRWFEERKKIVSATLAESVCLNPDQVVSSKLANVPSFTSAAMDKGTLYETPTKNLYSKLYNKVVYDVDLIIHPDYPHIGASPDGVTSDGINTEFKSVTSRAFGALPPKYWAQTQVQMFVLNLYMTNFFETRVTEIPLDAKTDKHFGYFYEIFNTTEKQLEYKYSPIDEDFVVESPMPILRKVKYEFTEYNMIEIPRDDEFCKLFVERATYVMECVNSGYDAKMLALDATYS